MSCGSVHEDIGYPEPSHQGCILYKQHSKQRHKEVLFQLVGLQLGRFNHRHKTRILLSIILAFGTGTGPQASIIEINNTIESLTTDYSGIWHRICYNYVLDTMPNASVLTPELEGCFSIRA